MSQLPGTNQAWVFVGSSGLGKSSHLKLFADEKDEIKVSGGAKSCTTDPKLYQHRDDKSIFLLDTVGFEDSTGQSDKHIMAQTFRLLCEKKVMDVKVIWFVKPEVRATSTLQTQAKFINSLLEGRIWQSTFVVVKEGQRKKQAQGALESSLEHGRGDGEDCALSVLMHTCVDWVKDPEDLEELLEDMADMSHEKRLKKGLLHEKEVLERFRAQLAQTPVARVIAKIDKCTRCGQVGDERCMPSKCHTSPVKVHLSAELAHEGSLVARHRGPVEYAHSGRILTRHRHPTTCRIEHWHGSREYYHPGDERYDYTYRHIFGSEIGGTRKVTRRYYQCCNKNKGSTGCQERCRDCGSSLGSHGCHSGRSCGSEEGCEMYHVFSCCQGPEGVQGCRQQLKCCGQWKESTRSKGCEEFYACCGKPPDSTGCAHACCGQAGEGCTKVCAKCGGEWNNAEAKGCSEAEEHDTEPWN